MRCRICGEKKTVFIDGTYVCDSCEVGGIVPDKKHKKKE